MIRYDRRKLPKEKRSIPMFATDEHKGKWFRCWNCGFPCFIDREKLDVGDRYGGVGYSIVESTGTYSPIYGVRDSYRMSLHTIGHDYLLAKHSGDDIVAGNASHSQQVSQGCPLCGCLRWK